MTPLRGIGLELVGLEMLSSPNGASYIRNQLGQIMTDKLLDDLLTELPNAGLNGWFNRETYCVAEWIAEDLEAWQALARECYCDATADNLLTRADVAWCDLGKTLTSRFCVEIEEEHRPLSRELLRLATTRINWTQLVWGVFQNRGKGTPREDFLRR